MLIPPEDDQGIGNPPDSRVRRVAYFDLGLLAAFTISAERKSNLFGILSVQIFKKKVCEMRDLIYAQNKRKSVSQELCSACPRPIF